MSGQKTTRRKFMAGVARNAAAFEIMTSVPKAMGYVSEKVNTRINNVNTSENNPLEIVANELNGFRRHCEINEWLYEGFGQLCLMAKKSDNYVLATTYTRDNITMPEVQYFGTKEKMYEKMKKLEKQGRAFAFLPLRD